MGQALTKNTITRIYQDPFTETKLEGEAKLLRKIEDYPDGMQYWEVLFDGDDTPVRRMIRQ